MTEYVQVAEEECEEPVELPTEEDNTLLLSTLVAQFPGACGLKYRCKESQGMRGIRLADGKLHPPEEGWKGNLYCCVFPKENKRKSDDNTVNSMSKTKRMESKLKCTDLIVLGLPWKVNDQQLREYFETYGELLMSQVKIDPKTGQSKGFGFIRFKDIESQMRVISQRHLIGERWCDVKIPNSKDGHIQQMPSKVFVGRVTQDMTAQDLKDYFSDFGEVTDVFIPKPFRAFAFVTFLDPEVANSLCGEDHLIKGVSVRTGMALPKNADNYSRNSGGYQGGPNRQMGMGGGSRRDWDDMRMGTSSPRSNNTTLTPNSGMGQMGMGMSGQGGGGGGGGGNMGGQGNTSDMQNVLLTAVNPMLVAAALNQAGWGLMGQGQQGGQNSQQGNPSDGNQSGSNPPPSNYGGGGGGGGGWMNNQGPPQNNSNGQQGMWSQKSKHEPVMKYN